MRVPLPLKPGPPDVGDGAADVVVDGSEDLVVDGFEDAVVDGFEDVVVDVPGGGAADVGDEPAPLPLGRYLIPVLGHVDFEPTRSEASKVPVCIEPCTLKKYQISFRAPLWQPR